MIRKIVLAALMAAVLSAGSPAWAAIGKINTRSNISKAQTPTQMGEDIPSDAAPTAEGSADAAPQGVADVTPSLASLGGGANDALSGFGPSSGTMVGNRALELRDDVLRLRSSVNLNASEFSLLRANGGGVLFNITARLPRSRHVCKTEPRVVTRSCCVNGKKPKQA